MVYSLTKRGSVSFFIILIFVYFSYVSNIIDVVSTIDYYNDINNYFQSESESDQNETKLPNITTPILKVKQGSNVEKNLTISKAKFLQSMTSQFVNISYRGTKNHTQQIIVEPTLKQSVGIKPLNYTQVFQDKQEFNVKKNDTIMKKRFFEYISKKLVNDSYAGADNYIQYILAIQNRKPLIEVKPLRPDFGPVLNDVTAFQYPIGIKPCLYDNGSRNLFVAIISAVDHFEKRESIRQTWLQALHQNKSENLLSVTLSGYEFITGQSKDKNVSIRIEEESKKHGDILQIDLIDNYYNLTLKVVGLMNWLNKYCHVVDFVLKVDDDVFLNVRNLEAIITKALKGSEQFLSGALMAPMKPERRGKWNISYEDWPWAKYPTYPSGGSVLFAGTVIGSLLAAAQVTPYIPFDDTYLLGLCTEKAGIKVFGFSRFFVVNGEVDPCHVYISWQLRTAESMNNSNLATENFYKNVTQCTMADSNGMNRTVNPFEFLLKIE